MRYLLLLVFASLTWAASNTQHPAIVIVNGHNGDKSSWYDYWAGILYARAANATSTEPLHRSNGRDSPKTDTAGKPSIRIIHAFFVWTTNDLICHHNRPHSMALYRAQNLGFDGQVPSHAAFLREPT